MSSAKKSLLTVIICLTLIFVYACSKNNVILPDEISDTFLFSLNFGVYGRNCIDTYNNTFTKDLVSAGTETIDFVIPPEKMREIYEVFARNDIPGLPSDINAAAIEAMGDQRSISTPSSLYILTYTLGDETRTVVCDGGGPWDAGDGPPETYERLMNLADFIAGYIYETQEYKQMSPAAGGYL